VYEKEVKNLSDDGMNRLLKTKMMEQFKKIILSKEKHIEVVARIGRAHPDWHNAYGDEVSKAKIYCLLIMDWWSYSPRLKISIYGVFNRGELFGFAGSTEVIMSVQEKFEFQIKSFAGTQMAQAYMKKDESDKHYHSGFHDGLQFALFWAGCIGLISEQPEEIMKKINRIRAGV
jgi:hypothetical protein